MTIKININTVIEIKSVNDLPKLKVIVEVNKLGKPNFSEIDRAIGVVPEEILVDSKHKLPIYYSII